MYIYFFVTFSYGFFVNVNVLQRQASMHFSELLVKCMSISRFGCVWKINTRSKPNPNGADRMVLYKLYYYQCNNSTVIGFWRSFVYFELFDKISFNTSV